MSDTIEGGNPEPPDLKRVIGFWAATSLVIGTVLGSGIFLKHGRLAADAGDVRLILVGWLVGGTVCVLGSQRGRVGGHAAPGRRPVCLSA